MADAASLERLRRSIVLVRDRLDVKDRGGIAQALAAARDDAPQFSSTLVGNQREPALPFAGVLHDAVQLLQHPHAGISGAAQRCVNERAEIDAKIAAAQSVIKRIDGLVAAHEALLRVDELLDVDAHSSNGKASGAGLSRLMHAQAALEGAAESVTAAQGGDITSKVIGSLWAAHARRAALIKQRGAALLRKAILSVVKTANTNVGELSNDSKELANLTISSDARKIGTLWAAAERLGLLSETADALCTDAIVTQVVGPLLDCLAKQRAVDETVVEQLISAASPSSVEAPSVSASPPSSAHASMQLLLRADAPVDGNDAFAAVGSVIEAVGQLAAFLRQHVCGGANTAVDRSGPAQVALRLIGRRLWSEGEGGIASALHTAIVRCQPPLPGVAASEADIAAAIARFSRYHELVLGAASRLEAQLQECGFISPASHADEASFLCFAQVAADAPVAWCHAWAEGLLEAGRQACQLAVAASEGHTAGSKHYNPPVPTQWVGEEASSGTTDDEQQGAMTSSPSPPPPSLSSLLLALADGAPATSSPQQVEAVGQLLAGQSTPSSSLPPQAAAYLHQLAPLLVQDGGESAGGDFFSLATHLPPRLRVSAIAAQLAQVATAAATHATAVTTAALTDSSTNAAWLRRLSSLLWSCLRDLLHMYTALVVPVLLLINHHHHSDVSGASAAALVHNDCVLLAHTTLGICARALVVSSSASSPRPTSASATKSDADDDDVRPRCDPPQELLHHLRRTAVGALMTSIRRHRQRLLRAVPRLSGASKRNGAGRPVPSSIGGFLGGDDDDVSDGDDDDHSASVMDAFDDEYGYHAPGEYGDDDEEEGNVTEERDGLHGDSSSSGSASSSNSGGEGGGGLNPHHRRRSATRRLAPAGLEAAVRSQGASLGALASAWREVLPSPLSQRATGHLADACLAALSSDVMGLPHISEPASRALAHLMRLQARVLLRALPGVSLQYLPHLERHAAVSRLLDARLSDIAAAAAAGQYRLLLSNEELAGLVGALFQPSQQREALLRRLRQERD